MAKVQTMDLKGKDYARVPERIKQFREDCPRGVIETTPTFLEGGDLMFKAYIVKDKSDESSSSATGHAHGKNETVKDFEKLETIAVGRALANLGYLASGEVASTEEMEEYEAMKQERFERDIEEATKQIEKAKDLDKLKELWINLPAEIRDALEVKKEEVKQKLSKV